MINCFHQANANVHVEWTHLLQMKKVWNEQQVLFYATWYIPKPQAERLMRQAKRQVGRAKHQVEEANRQRQSGLNKEISRIAEIYPNYHVPSTFSSHTCNLMWVQWTASNSSLKQALIHVNSLNTSTLSKKPRFLSPLRQATCLKLKARQTTYNTGSNFSK